MVILVLEILLKSPQSTFLSILHLSQKRLANLSKYQNRMSNNNLSPSQTADSDAFENQYEAIQECQN